MRISQSILVVKIRKKIQNVPLPLLYRTSHNKFELDVLYDLEITSKSRKIKEKKTHNFVGFVVAVERSVAFKVGLDTRSVLASKVGFRAGSQHTGTVFTFIGSVLAVVLTVAHPMFLDAVAVAARELLSRARRI